MSATGEICIKFLPSEIPERILCPTVHLLKVFLASQHHSQPKKGNNGLQSAVWNFFYFHKELSYLSRVEYKQQ